MTFTRLIITGANGSGKTHLARKLTERRPDLEVISYDALRLTQNWVKRPEDETAKALISIVQKDSWLLEGGPSLLEHALDRCQGVIWLDLPERLRAWRLAIRPWKNIGCARAELPDGKWIGHCSNMPLPSKAFEMAILRNRQSRHVSTPNRRRMSGTANHNATWKSHWTT